MSFKGKTVLVTGAASGIGLLCSRCFASEGANVAMLDINGEALDKECGEINREGGKALALVTDVTRYEEIKKACEKTVEAFGTLDITVSCAGGSATRIKGLTQADFIDIPMEVYDWGIDLNFKHPVYVAHTAMNYMAKQGGGVIINIGSVTGEEGSPFGIDYAASKSGVMYGLTKSLAMAGAKYGVRVCCVSPGPVLTRAKMAEMATLLGRAADPQEVVDMILYLASDKAAFITGTNYFIDGGRLVLRNKEKKQ